MSSLEQEYYEYDGFWNRSSPIFGHANMERVQSIWQILPLHISSLADIGCGNGIFSNFAKQKNPNLKIYALDRSRTALSYVQTDKALADIANLPYPDMAFDCVVSLEVLEHLPIRIFETAKKEIARLASKYIVVSVPNDQDLTETMTQCPACKTIFHPDLHMRSFNSSSMNRLFAANGFRCERVQEIGTYTKLRNAQTYRTLQSLLSGRNTAYGAEMESPLCPICGFVNDNFLTSAESSKPVKRSIRPKAFVRMILSKIIFKVWPRVTKSNWIAALYSRTS